MMSQNDLNREVAIATGESISSIKRLGFMIADPSVPIEDPFDPNLGGRVVDWDAYDLLREDF